MIDVDSVTNCVERVPLRSKWLFAFCTVHVRMLFLEVAQELRIKAKLQWKEIPK
jgi:hypothetical protein